MLNNSFANRKLRGTSFHSMLLISEGCGKRLLYQLNIICIESLARLNFEEIIMRDWGDPKLATNHTIKYGSKQFNVSHPRSLSDWHPSECLPSSDLGDINENRLIRWQRVEQLRQHFWRIWSVEYIHSLQERHKWKANKGQQLRVGQLVLLKQDLIPLHWIIGRIEQVHADSEGNTRSAAIKMPSGSLVRPLSKIAILPLES